MHFGNIRKNSVKIGKDLKVKNVSGSFRKPRVHSVSGRHNDDRRRNALGVFRKAPEDVFIIFDLYRYLTEIAEVYKTHVTLKFQGSNGAR